MSDGMPEAGIKGTNNYISQNLWDVIICPCPWYLLLAHHSWYVGQHMDLQQYQERLGEPGLCLAHVWLIVYRRPANTFQWNFY